MYLDIHRCIKFNIGTILLLFLLALSLKVERLGLHIDFRFLDKRRVMDMHKSVLVCECHGDLFVIGITLYSNVHKLDCKVDQILTLSPKNSRMEWHAE